MKAKDAAYQTLVEMWRRRGEFWPADVDVDEFLHDAPEVFIKHFRGYRLERPLEICDDIPSQRGIVTGSVAGLVDPVNRTVQVARNQTPEVQRFTMAHEIGHMVMHPGVSSHRDRVENCSNQKRPKIDWEADDFAANFLMPEKHLTSAFLANFRDPITFDKLDSDLAFKLTSATGNKITALELRGMRPYERACIFACISEFGVSTFTSLVNRYTVSKSALARRLVELGLVS